MKRLISIVVLLSAAFMCIGDAFSASNAEKNIFLSIILDSSPNTEKQWTIMKALLLQSVHSLRQGDKLEILLARPGNPSTKMSIVLGQLDSFERDQIIEIVSGMHKEFLFGADLGKAMKTAFATLQENDSKYQCGLMVLTDGNVSYGQADQICKMSSVLRARGWPVCITCDSGEANRRLLAAGNRNEIDLRFIDRPFLSQWISSVRSYAASVADRPEPKRTAADEGRDIPTAAEDSSVQPAPKREASAGSAVGKREPVDVRIIDMPAFTPGGDAGARDTSDANDVALERRAVAKDSEELEFADHQPDDETAQTGSRKPLPLLALTAGGLLAAGLFAAAYLVRKDRLSVAAARGDVTAGDGPSQSIPSHIVAYIGDRRQDLGDADAALEITLGKGLGSTVYIDNEGVSDTHVRIFRARKILKVQNLAAIPIVINGAELRPKAKTQLDLPADIELAPGVSVTLLTEPIEADTEDQSDGEDKA